MRGSRAYSRVERKLQIVGCFQQAIQNGQPNRLTMYQVTAMLNVTPQTKYQQMMLELVEEGTLSFVIENKGNSWKRVFSLVGVTQQQRSIRINGIKLEMEI